MTNSETIFLLKAREKTLEMMESWQKNFDALELVRLERKFVQATIEFREKYGGLEQIVIKPDSGNA